MQLCVVFCFVSSVRVSLCRVLFLAVYQILNVCIWYIVVHCERRNRSILIGYPIKQTVARPSIIHRFAPQPHKSTAGLSATRSTGARVSCTFSFIFTTTVVPFSRVYSLHALRSQVLQFSDTIFCFVSHYATTSRVSRLIRDTRDARGARVINARARERETPTSNVCYHHQNCMAHKIAGTDDATLPHKTRYMNI